MAVTAPRLLLIPDRILNSVTTTINGVLPNYTYHQLRDTNARRKRKTREAGAAVEKTRAEADFMKTSLSRLPNEIIIMILRILVDESVDEVVAVVCLALTSKRIAQLAIQTRIIIPKRMLPDELLLVLARAQEWEQWSAIEQWSASPINHLNNGPPIVTLLPWFSRVPKSRVRPEDYDTVTTSHHKLMIALRDWMPTEMVYCAYCGKWRLTTLCHAHEEASSILVSLDHPRLTTVDRKPYVCRSCLMKGSSKLHEVRASFSLLLCEEEVKRWKRFAEESKEARRERLRRSWGMS